MQYKNPPNTPDARMSPPESAYQSVLARVARAAASAGAAPVSLLAVSKTRSGSAVRALHAQGQRLFAENYVQEALAKQAELRDLDLEWHLIGPLQSNKCREVARHFDWLQTFDRVKLIAPLALHRTPQQAPLNVLIQVNIDDEASKSGCSPSAIGELAVAVAACDRLRLRGLMAIPKAHPDPALRRATLRRMHALFETLRAAHAGIDTLSLGMSDDFEMAIAEGSTMVRIGTALFGRRD